MLPKSHFHKAQRLSWAEVRTSGVTPIHPSAYTLVTWTFVLTLAMGWDLSAVEATSPSEMSPGSTAPRDCTASKTRAKCVRCRNKMFLAPRGNENLPKIPGRPQHTAKSSRSVAISHLPPCTRGQTSTAQRRLGLDEASRGLLPAGRWRRRAGQCSSAAAAAAPQSPSPCRSPAAAPAAPPRAVRGRSAAAPAGPAPDRPRPQQRRWRALPIALSRLARCVQHR